IAPLPQYALGCVLLSMGRWSEALLRIEEALNRDPAAFVLHRVRGWAHLRMGQHAQAIEAFEQSVALSLRHHWFVADLGVAHAEAGHAGEARKLQEELVARSNSAFVSGLILSHIPI